MGKVKVKRPREDGCGDGSSRGPPVLGSGSGHLGGGGGASDDWQTTERSWAAIAELLAPWRDKRVWMPFYYDGVCADHVRGLGFSQVHHRQGEDFFIKARA